MSKNNHQNSSQNKIPTPKNIKNLDLNPSKYFSYTNKMEHIRINSDRNPIENIEEINLIPKANKFNTTFYEKESKKTEYNTNKELPPLNYKKSYERYKFSSTFYKNEKNSVKTLKKKVKELNGEINKLKKDSNVKN